MPYINEWKAQGLERKFSGDITGLEVLKSNISIQSDPRFTTLKYVLNDFTGIDSFDVSEINITEISALDKIASKYSGKLKIIIVTNNKSLLEWVNLYLVQMENSPYDVAIFNNRESAFNSIPN